MSARRNTRTRYGKTLSLRVLSRLKDNIYKRRKQLKPKKDKKKHQQQNCLELVKSNRYILVLVEVELITLNIILDFCFENSKFSAHQEHKYYITYSRVDLDRYYNNRKIAV